MPKARMLEGHFQHTAGRAEPLRSWSPRRTRSPLGSRRGNFSPSSGTRQLRL